MRTNKLVSFLCSMAVMASSFVGLVSVNAADGADTITDGVDLVYNKEKSTSKTADLDVYVKGFTSMSSYSVGLAVEGATIESISYTVNVDGFTPSDRKTPGADGTVMFGGYISVDEEVPVSEDTPLANVVITFTEDLTEDVIIKLTDDTELTSTAIDKTRAIYDGSMKNVEVTALADPTATEPPAPTKEPITDGVDLVYNQAKSTSQTANIDVYVKGFASMSSYSVGLAVDGATIESIEYTVNVVGFTPSDRKTPGADGTVMFGGYISVDEEVAVSEDTPIANVTITFTEPLTKDVIVKLTDDTELTSTAIDKTRAIYDGSMKNVEVVVLADPTVTENPSTENPATENPATDKPTETAAPVVTSRPTKAPVPTEVAPTEPAPTKEPITDGVDLVYNKAKSTSQTANIDVYVKGFASMSSYSVGLAVDGATIESIEYTVNVEGFTPSDRKTPGADGTVMFGGYIAVDEEVPVSEDTPIANVTITFTEPLTKDVIVKLTDDTELTSTAIDKTRAIYDGSMKNVEVVILADPTVTEAPTPTASPEPTAFPADGEIKLSDLAKDFPKDGLTGILVESNGEYGVDYVAVYKDKQLTLEEYSNLINGYADPIEDVIAGMVFAVKYDKTITATPYYENEDGTITILPAYSKSDVVTKATEKPTTKPTEKPTQKPGNDGSGSRTGGGGSGQIANGNLGGVSQQPGAVGFQDLGNVPWAVEAINSLAGLGIVNGRSATIFDPEATVTRAEFAKMVCNAFGIAANAGGEQRFTDVSPSDWYYSWVQAAAAAGIINGVSATEFAPNALVTREQMAAMLYRAIVNNNVSIRTGASINFNDAWAISEYAVESVDKLSAAGIINGLGNNEFGPQQSATRAQAACIIYQYLRSLGV